MPSVPPVGGVPQVQPGVPAPGASGAPFSPTGGAGYGGPSYGGGGYPSGAAGGGYAAPGAPSAPSATPPGWYDAGNGTTMWWDGFRWQAQAPGPALAPYRPLAGLAVVVQAGLALTIVLSGFTIWNDSSRRTMIDGFFDGTVTFDEIDAADDTAAVLGVVALVVLALTGIAFLIWRHRVQRNLRDALAVRSLEYTPGWAVGWWFVPFANLVKPKQAMNEAWIASDPAAPAWTPAGRRGKAPSILSWWWGTWIASGLISQFASSQSNGIDVTPDDFRSAMDASVTAEMLSIVAALLLMSIVRQIGKRQAQRAVALGVRSA